MPRRGDSPAHEDEREEHEEQELPADKNGSVKQIKRQVSVYDAVAGQFAGVIRIVASDIL